MGIIPVSFSIHLLRKTPKFQDKIGIRRLLIADIRAYIAVYLLGFILFLIVIAIFILIAWIYPDLYKLHEF